MSIVYLLSFFWYHFFIFFYKSIFKINDLTSVGIISFIIVIPLLIINIQFYLKTVKNILKREDYIVLIISAIILIITRNFLFGFLLIGIKGIYDIIFYIIKSKMEINKIILSFMLFYVIVFLSTLINGNITINSFSNVFNILILPFISIFCIIIYRAFKDEIFKYIKVSFVLVVFLFNLASLILILLGNLDFTYPGDRFRVYGLFLNPNATGIFNVISILFSLYFYSNSKNKWFYFSSILSAVMCLLSDSRASLLSLILLIIMKIITDKKSRILVFSIICISFLCTQFMQVGIKLNYEKNISNSIVEVIDKNNNIENDVVDNVLKKDIWDIINEKHDLNLNVSSLIKKIDVISSNRLALWTDSFIYVLKKPIFGYGLNYYGKNITYVVKDVEITHNIFIETLVVSGTVGIILFLYCIYQCVVHIINNKKIMLDDIFYLMIMLVYSLLDQGFLFNFSALSVIFWFVLGKVINNE